MLRAPVPTAHRWLGPRAPGEGREMVVQGGLCCLVARTARSPSYLCLVPQSLQLACSSWAAQPGLLSWHTGTLLVPRPASHLAKQ